MSARDSLARGFGRAALVGVMGLVLVAFGRPADAQDLDFDFYRENIEPMFYRSRGDFMPPDPGDPACVMCHTWQTNTPLKLQRLEENADGSVYWTEAQSRQNFAVVSSLVTPGDPDNSRLLLKPLHPSAGGTAEHTGGKFWDSRNDPEYQTLAQWVGAAAPAAAADAPDVDFEFFRACVHPMFFQATPGGMACTNCHGDEFAPPDVDESWSLVQRLIAPGAPTQSRLLMHPLHPDAGGDYVHNGVRRWRSQDDPEWQMLAGWVNGERTGTMCRR
jgi:hypothetical protein